MKTLNLFGKVVFVVVLLLLIFTQPIPPKPLMERRSQEEKDIDRVELDKLEKVRKANSRNFDFEKLERDHLANIEMEERERRLRWNTP